MKSIRGRMMLTLTLAVTVTLIIMAVISGIAFRSHFNRYLEEGVRERHQNLIEFFAAGEGNFEQRGLTMTLNRLVRMEEDLEIEIRNKEGVTVFDSTEHMPMMRRGWPGGETEEEEKIISRTWIEAGGEELEVILISPLGTPMWSPTELAFQESLGRSLLLALIISLAGALLLSGITAGKITRPIWLLQQAAAGFSGGNWEARVEVKTGDELEELGQKFNLMAANIQHLESLRLKMTSDLAHELHNPLMSIQNYIEGMQDGVIAPDAEHLEELEEEVSRLIRLVADLQRLARLENRRLETEEFSPRETFQAYLEKWERVFSAEAISFQWNIGAGQFRGDPGLIKEVLQNLLENALRYNTADTRVWCLLEKTGEQLKIEVGDIGPGISEEDQPYIFERFFRGRNHKKSGTGIGLAIVRELVELMGGSIELISGEKQGAIFKISLPPS